MLRRRSTETDPVVCVNNVRQLTKTTYKLRGVFVRLITPIIFVHFESITMKSSDSSSTLFTDRRVFMCNGIFLFYSLELITWTTYVNCENFTRIVSFFLEIHFFSKIFLMNWCHLEPFKWAIYSTHVFINNEIEVNFITELINVRIEKQKTKWYLTAHLNVWRQSDLIYMHF